MPTEIKKKEITKIKPLEFEAFGVKIGVFCDDSELRKKVKKILPVVVPSELTFKKNDFNEQIFFLYKDETDESVVISRNDEEELKIPKRRGRKGSATKHKAYYAEYYRNNYSNGFINCPNCCKLIQKRVGYVDI